MQNIMAEVNAAESQFMPEISVAPMMDWTDRHCRFFHRLIAPGVRLYTEMVTTGALIHGERERFLRFSPQEHPVALQLGGSDPDDLARSAAWGAETGYDEINLNCGCPSDAVQKGRFGVCLMREPEHVAACVAAMRRAVSADIPITVKCRIGVDHQDDYAFLRVFVERVIEAGCSKIIIHARKAWLKGLSPKENREIPPLDYERAAMIKRDFPSLPVIVNGGIKTADEVTAHLKVFDGVMIGREAYQNPWILREMTDTHSDDDRAAIARAMISYAAAQRELFGTPIKSITRHMMGLFHGQPNGKRWRRMLSTLPHADGADERVIETALENL